MSHCTTQSVDDQAELSSHAAPRAAGSDEGGSGRGGGEEEEGDHHSKTGLMGTSTKGTLLIIIRVW